MNFVQMGKAIPTEERKETKRRWDDDAVIEAESTIAMVFVLQTGLELGPRATHHLLQGSGGAIVGRIRVHQIMRASCLHLFAALQSARGKDNQSHLGFRSSDS